ncbi:MAG: hypothetical protein A2675_01895 [Candidatus Yonathbacteria bacterium RIFCSPHIGHO2_01_FULL_51_10]|uniref:Fibronectin type-III domain-containing protein n=1 Tax=Candidatus Yonathbacteria bacterium RIFCSPHIGHO2_01_FULL_51_10 TaxID=1802723 RepID=A0A1G2S9Y8_9BACT|nr:MAG: hypothetical protein A2675_01895 [Candidatus Yonathbacteria bacterium RIFCSPHIGHO2_01_FULL_51_10]
MTGYKLYRGGALVTTGNMLTYTDYDLTVNTTYTVSAYDAAGNVSAQSTGVTVTTPATADTTAPTVSLSGITSGASYTSAQTVTINATASDNSGVSKVEFYDNNVLKGTDTASPYSYSWSIASSADNGTHAWTVKAYDATGNTATSGSVSVTVNIPIAVADTTAPSIFAWSTIPTASFSINPYTLTAAQTVNISITVSDNIGVSKVEFYDGTTLKATNTTSPYSFTWGVTSADNGTHSLMMKAYDAAGNVASSVATSVIVNIVTADTTAPTVSLSASATSITTAQTVTFTATASDNVGVSSVTFTYGAYSSVSTDNTSPYSLSLNLSSSHNGIYTVTAKAYDTTGNSATSNTVSVSVNIPIDTTAPTKPTNLKATNITSTDTTLSWTASTDNVGVTGYVVKVYLSGLLGPAYNVTSGTTFTVSGLTPSTSYTYTVYAKDASYNASAESTAVTVKTLAAVASAATGWSQSASVLGAMGNSTNNGMDVTRASSQVKTKTTLTYNWTRNLQVGSSYQDDITALQTALVDQGMFTEEVSGGFYSKTFIAVKAFQKKYGINPTGFVGPLTRAKLNELYR